MELIYIQLHRIHPILQSYHPLIKGGLKELSNAKLQQNFVFQNQEVLKLQMRLPTIKNLLVFFLLSVSLMFLVGLLQADPTIISFSTFSEVRMVIPLFVEIQRRTIKYFNYESMSQIIYTPMFAFFGKISSI